MKVVLLAGGFGSRLSEETGVKPKPLVEIGGRPIIWHIMNYYASFGHKEFVILCGYKGEMIKKYFIDYFTINYDLKVDLSRNSVEYIGAASEDWNITLLDTGNDVMTGGRIRRASKHLTETFMLTYGDGLSDVDIDSLLESHKAAGKLCTVTTVPSPGRFGVLETDADGTVRSFSEKPENEVGLINGGFFVVEPDALNLIAGDSTSWEREPMAALVENAELNAFHHNGFWRPMDTLRDKRELERILESGDVPWQR